MKNYVSLKSNKQLSAAYAVYEIVGSEFHRCSFQNPLLEEKLRVNFLLESDNAQCLLEEKAEKAFKKLNIETSDLNCEVYGMMNPNTNHFIIYFRTYVADIIAVIDERGRIALSL